MKKINFPLTVIKIFMKNQMQNKTYLMLDMFNMISRCLIVFLLYAYVFKISGGTIKGVDYTTTLWSMFIYFCIMTFNIRKIDTLIITVMMIITGLYIDLTMCQAWFQVL